jgi:hypothetical protein
MTQAGVAPDHAERVARDNQVLPQRTLRNLQVAAVLGHRVVIGHDSLLLQPQFFRNTGMRNMRSDRPLASGEWARCALRQAVLLLARIRADGFSSLGRSGNAFPPWPARLEQKGK